MSLAALRRFARPATGGSAREERCEMCGAGLGIRHGHVVGLDQRTLACACRPCYLLFTRDGAGGGRFRAVPERYLADPAHPLTDTAWESLGIPVTTAFCFLNSDLGRPVAVYPSPAGATECVLDPPAWQRLCRTHPLFATAAPDVEAVYVTGTAAGLAAYLVPIDACYRLVGEVRLHWRGLDGGGQVRRILADFREELRRRSRDGGRS